MVVSIYIIIHSTWGNSDTVLMIPILLTTVVLKPEFSPSVPKSSAPETGIFLDN